jgi:hypothetical protein
VTDYVLEAPVRCLQCGAQINEKTLIWSSLTICREFTEQSPSSSSTSFRIHPYNFSPSEFLAFILTFPMTEEKSY